MVRVNRNKLSDTESKHLFKRFDNTLAKLDRTAHTTFLNELLGKEERLTIAKRLAAIVLIHEGCSEYKTSRVLKLSPSTTGIIGKKIEDGSYNNILRLLKRRGPDYLELLDTIDSIFHLGGFLPHRVGLDRYRAFRKP